MIAQAGFPAEFSRQQPGGLPFRYFFGDVPTTAPDIVPDQLVIEPTALTVGGTELILYPTRAARPPTR